MLTISVLQDRWVGLQSSRIATFVRDEHQYKADTARYKFLVVLSRQFVDMLLDWGNMFLQIAFTLRGILFSDCCLISCQWNLSIYHGTFFIREDYHGIWSEVITVLVLVVLLQKILLTLNKTAVFQRLIENHLTPIALHLRVTFKGLCERSSIITNTFRLFTQFFYCPFLILTHSLDSQFLLRMKTFHRLLEGRFNLCFIGSILLAIVCNSLIKSF